MSKMTGLTSGAITAVYTVTIELVEADENPAVVIVRWPAKPTVFHPRSFPSGADIATKHNCVPGHHPSRVKQSRLALGQTDLRYLIWRLARVRAIDVDHPRGDHDDGPAGRP